MSARVIGFRLVDGMATLSMKKSALDTEVMSYESMYPGMLLTAGTSRVERGWGQSMGGGGGAWTLRNVTGVWLTS